MNLRELAESQLSCQQQAQAAEAAARQTAHVHETSRECTEWFLAVLKTIPESVEVTSKYDDYRGSKGCRVVVDGITFSWVDDINLLKFRSSDPALEVKPGVAVIEARELPKSGRVSWYKVVTEHSYSSHGYATDLPSLAQHLHVVDKVHAKRRG